MSDRSSLNVNGCQKHARRAKTSELVKISFTDPKVEEQLLELVQYFYPINQRDDLIGGTVWFADELISGCIIVISLNKIAIRVILTNNGDVEFSMKHPAADMWTRFHITTAPMDIIMEAVGDLIYRAKGQFWVIC